MSAVMERKKPKRGKGAKEGEQPLDRTETELVNHFANLLPNLQPNLMRIDEFERHPENRVPDQLSVDTMAESIRTIGQIDAIVARRRENRRFQILSGETRWLAMRSLGSVLISARVIECTDAQALALVAEANAKRTDLTVIQRAQLLRRLMAPVAEGGGGLPRDAAAKTFGIEPSTVSNLVKLLDAPPEWQRRLDSPDLDHNGDPVRIHQATVREVAKLAVAPRLLKAIEEDYRDSIQDQWCEEVRGSRETQMSWLSNAVDQYVRRLDGRFYVGNYGYHETAFDVDEPGVAERLEVYELPVGDDGKMVRAATNIELFDELQLAAVKAKQDGGSRKSSAASGDVSPAEQRKIDRARRKKADEQLKAWIEDWSQRLLRCSMAEYLSGDDALWMAPWLLTHAHASGMASLGEYVDFAAEASGMRLRGAANGKCEPTGGRDGLVVMRTRRLARDAHAKQQADSRAESVALLLRICRLVLWPHDPESHRVKLIPSDLPDRLPYISRDSLLEWASAIGATIEDAWQDGTTDGAVERQLIAEYLTRHNSEQLADLRDELCPDLVLPKGKSAAVAALLAEHKPGRPLPLPAAVALKEKRKTK